MKKYVPCLQQPNQTLQEIVQYGYMVQANDSCNIYNSTIVQHGYMVQANDSCNINNSTIVQYGYMVQANDSCNIYNSTIVQYGYMVQANDSCNINNSTIVQQYNMAIWYKQTTHVTPTYALFYILFVQSCILAATCFDAIIWTPSGS